MEPRFLLYFFYRVDGLIHSAYGRHVSAKGGREVGKSIGILLCVDVMCAPKASNASPAVRARYIYKYV